MDDTSGSGSGCDVSLLILTKNEAPNLASLLPSVKAVLGDLVLSFEVVVMDAGSSDGTAETAVRLGAWVYQQELPGYGAAFREGVSHCVGKWILTMDADHSHPPQVVRALLSHRENADLVIASRFVPGGDSHAPRWRNLLSRILNRVFRTILTISNRDLSSGFRLYRRSVLREIHPVGRDFDVLIEVVIEMVTRGYRVAEIPFIYEPREYGVSNARVLRFAWSYLRTLRRLWQLRNREEAADYEERAYRSVIPLQRYWQRRRAAHVLELCERTARTLDIGSGGGRVARSFPHGVALDRNLNPLRFLSARGIVSVGGDIRALPFATNSFEQVILNEVIQYLPPHALDLGEVRRVLRRDGVLVLGTPDRASVIWKVCEHLYRWAHPVGGSPRTWYTRQEIYSLLERSGFRCERERDVLGADRIYRARNVKD